MARSMSPSIRIDKEIHSAAKLVASVMSRSAAQQISHWARIGREFESTNTSAAAVGSVLAGHRNYDDLDDSEQAIVRAEWEERLTIRHNTFDLRAALVADGEREWVGLDEHENLVEYSATGETKILE